MPTTAETEAERRRRQREEELLLLLLAFTWSDEHLAYFTRNGQRVPQATVRNAVDAVVKATAEDVAEVSRSVSSGDTTVAEWQDSVARRLKTLHVATAAAAAGGFEGLSPAVLAQLQGRLQFHLTKLEGFAQDLAQGFTVIESEQVDSETGEVQVVRRVVPMTESRILQRSQMYVVAAASDGYEGTRGKVAILAGYKFERNVLHPADHCDGCLGEDARGWVPIGQLVPIGRRDCLTHCRCSMQFARELPN